VVVIYKKVIRRTSLLFDSEYRKFAAALLRTRVGDVARVALKVASLAAAIESAGSIDLFISRITDLYVESLFCICFDLSVSADDDGSVILRALTARILTLSERKTL
jgi:hypothetical protein